MSGPVYDYPTWGLDDQKLLEQKRAIADSGKPRRVFATGAVRDISEGKGRMDLLPAAALIRLSKHYEKGELKYPPDADGIPNWQKGIPISSFIDSALRHTLKYLDGQNDEDHLTAAAWNLLCAMWTEERKPEMQDIASRKEVK